LRRARLTERGFGRIGLGVRPRGKGDWPNCSIILPQAVAGVGRLATSRWQNDEDAGALAGGAGDLAGALEQTYPCCNSNVVFRGAADPEPI
jgi:hypothetical protein